MDRRWASHLSSSPSPSPLAFPGVYSKCLKAKAPGLGARDTGSSKPWVGRTHLCI